MNLLNIGNENIPIEYKHIVDIFPKIVSCIFKITSKPIQNIDISMDVNNQIHSYNFEIRDDNCCEINMSYLSAFYQEGNSTIHFDKFFKTKTFFIDKKIISGFIKKFNFVENIKITIKNEENSTYLYNGKEYSDCPYIPCGGIFEKNINFCQQLYIQVQENFGVIKIPAKNLKYDSSIIDFIDHENTLIDYIKNGNLKFNLYYQTETETELINIISKEQKLSYKNPFGIYESFDVSNSNNEYTIKVDFRLIGEKK